MNIPKIEKLQQVAEPLVTDTDSHKQLLGVLRSIVSTVNALVGAHSLTQGEDKVDNYIKSQWLDLPKGQGRWRYEAENLKPEYIYQASMEVTEAEPPSKSGEKTWEQDRRCEWCKEYDYTSCTVCEDAVEGTIPPKSPTEDREEVKPGWACKTNKAVWHQFNETCDCATPPQTPANISEVLEAFDEVCQPQIMNNDICPECRVDFKQLKQFLRTQITALLENLVFDNESPNPQKYGSVGDFGMALGHNDLNKKLQETLEALTK